MSERSQALPVRVALVAAAIVAIVSSMAVARVRVLRALELKVMDLELRGAAGRMAGTDSVVVVGIDREALEKLPRWGPGALDRRAYVPVIEALADAGAAAIAVDVFFTPTATGADELLAEAIRKAGNVVVVAGANVKVRDGREVVQFEDPAEPIASAAARIASPLLFRPDNVVRWVRLRQRDLHGALEYPALCLAAVQVGGMEDKAGASAARDLMMIHWSGPQGAVKTLRFLDVHRGEFDRSDVDGRIVFVGRVGDEEDLLQTPVGPMYGVEIHAQAAATLVGDCAPRMVGFAWAMAAGILVSIVVGLSARAARTWAAWMVGLVGAGLWLAACYLALVKLKVALMPLVPAMAALGSGVVVSALKAEVTVRSLGKLWPSWVGGGMEEVEATVLVCDLAGYTKHAEHTAPMEVMELLQRFFALVEDTVEEYGGVIARRPGDAAIVLFRSEGEGDNAAARAVKAAVALRERMERAVMGTRTAEEGVEGFGITVVSGPVSVGFVGKSSPEPQVIGDPVNVAFRLQAEARRMGERVLIDGATADRAGGVVRLRALGSVQVRHRRQPVELYAPQE